MTIRPLTRDEASRVINVANTAIAGGRWVAEMQRIIADLRSGNPRYFYGEYPIQESMREELYSKLYAINTPDWLAIVSYLNIVDQRGTDVRVSGFTDAPAPAPAPVPAPAPAPVAIPPQGDFAPAVWAVLKNMGFFLNPDGTIRWINYVEPNNFGATTKGDPEGPIHGFSGMSDGGKRSASGWQPTGQPVPNDTRSNPNFPTVFFATPERDGGISADWFGWPGDSTAVRGLKTVVMYLQGFVKGIGPRRYGVGKYVDINFWEKGRGVRVNTLAAGDPDIQTGLQIDAENPNAACIRVGNQLRRIVLGADGKTLEAGEVVDEYQ